MAANDLRTAVGSMLTACAVVTSALSGMRSEPVHQWHYPRNVPTQLS
ncbi:hypothetical protein ACFQL8_14580 [Streptomyces goshikiensis]|nr:hypothetical protein [Streptomyces goshikiensis]